MKTTLHLIILVTVLGAQGTALGQKGANDYLQFYPMGDAPNMRYITSYRKEETILFEANPVVRYSFINNFYKRLLNDSIHAFAVYVAVKPHLRMFVENSLPVKTPSQRVLIGTQHLYRLSTPKGDRGERFVGFSVESGHYSNGQSRSAFSEDFADASLQGDSLYNLITPQTDLSAILNREGGNFSTNLTELILNYRQYRLDNQNRPKKMHSVSAGLMYYHDKFLFLLPFGGYSDQDIKIYGHYRFLIGYEYMRVLRQGEGMRITFSHKIELISGAHPSVNPYRSETSVGLYPFTGGEPKERPGKKPKIKDAKAFGFCASFIAGHDNYNYRFVDSGSQFTIGNPNATSSCSCGASFAV